MPVVTGGERIQRRSVPPGLSSRLPPCTLHRGREHGRPSSPAPCHRPQSPPAPCRTPQPSRGGQAFPTGLAAGGEPRGAAPVVPEAAEKPSHSAEEPPQGTFFFPHCVAQSCLSLFIPCQQCVKGKTSLGSRHGAGYLLSRSQPRQGLTAAKSQGLSRFGSLQSEKEPPCFLCCFFQTHQRRAACNPSGPKSLGGTRSPSGGAWHSPQSCGTRGATCTLPQH